VEGGDALVAGASDFGEEANGYGFVFLVSNNLRRQRSFHLFTLLFWLDARVDAVLRASEVVLVA